MSATEILYNWTWNGYNPIAVGWQTCEPGRAFGPGVREFYTVHYVLSGTGTYIVKGKEYKPKAGDLFVCSPYENIRYQADERDPWRYVWIHFIISGDVPYRFEKPLVHAPELRPVFRKIQHYTDHDNTGRDFVAGCLREMADRLCAENTNTSSLVDQAVQYIHLHYSDESLSIQQVADKLGVCRSWLTKAFSKEKNLTPIEYLIHYRLEKACEYMTTRELTSRDAAYFAGYKNYEHFTKIFKKYYGMSPGEYQKIRNGDS